MQGAYEPLKSVKAIKFTYEWSAEVPSLLETFRRMCNDAVHIALTEKPKSRFDLIGLSYRRLKEYRLHTHYILNACEVAYSTYRNKNRKCDPYVKKPFLKLDNQTYELDYLLLRIPTQPRKFLYIILNGSLYHRSFLADKSLKLGSVTITDSTIVIAFSKEIAMIEPSGQIGIDVNERNVTMSDTSGRTIKHDTSEVAELKERYKTARARIAQRTQKDRRIQQRLLAKYCKRERNRTIQAIHRVSRTIVQEAKWKRFGIVMEKLKGIRKLYRKGNGQGRAFRGRMNSWMFLEIQREIEYKAGWEGIPVVYVNARGTSRNCPDCGSRVVPLQERKLFCAECDKVWDRDVLASRNIMACVVPQARPPACSGDGESRRQETAGNPRSRRVEVSLEGDDVPTS